MALEAGNGFISGLVATNPVNATDQVAQGDDHLRLIKTALLGSFPNLGAAAVTPTAAALNQLVTPGAALMIADINLLTDPGAHAVLGWDDTANAVVNKTASTGITIAATTVAVDTATVPLLASSNTFTGATQTISHATDPKLAVTDTTAPVTAILQADGANTKGVVGTTTAHALELQASATSVLSLAVGGAVTSPNLAAAVGYKGMPVTVITTNDDHPLAAANNGCHLRFTGTTPTLTITQGLVDGFTCTVFNRTGASFDIDSDDTMIVNGAVDAGPITLANAYAITLIKSAGTEWCIQGPGLS